ncbi:protein phosphatase [Streptomyces sp. WAC 06738]|uniref:PP2C family protein-serine/threonine phosphatase n=1 Tax=Streptomyces sp. WAC 06738 TaxID=2203210 RepID=UPI000F6F6D7B|nr:PP2C family serine/threonine-protein phosphatase [Streptomyces sp. WAC 06738]AZM47314.1 protein phosphatase [Streptomyces sp. WAC 06738]
MRMYPEPTGEVRMSLSLRFAAGSHEGMIRDHNEDSGYAGPRLLAIADGMGGQAAGEVASSEVISVMVALDEDVPGSDLLTALGTTVEHANDRLRRMVEEDPRLEGMGTTLTALLWTGQRLGLVHVGDSRAYLLRDGALTQITKDHTWVQRLVDENRITEEEATTHPQRSLLMRALGSGDQVEPDLSIREVRAGDRYLVCSDGLSSVVSHETMENTLAGYAGPQETVQELIELALRGGGPDNITVIIADVLDAADDDTMAGRLNDAPLVVGAVAENQHQIDTAGMQTPAARAAGLGRPTPPQAGGFGPAGDGGDPYGLSYNDEDFVKAPPRFKWLKRGLLIAVVLGGLGFGGYKAYDWTQSQYYVGMKDDHVAVYQGIDQKLAWMSLSSVHQDHPDIELKYLPTYQQKRVEDNIAEESLGDAQAKVADLQEQADVCRTVAEAEAADSRAREEERRQQEQEKQNPDKQGDAGDKAGDSAGDEKAESPAPGASLTEEEQKLARQCPNQ